MPSSTSSSEAGQLTGKSRADNRASHRSIGLILAGICLIGTGISVYITEIWRDTEGRGTLLDGALDGPQAGAVLLVLAGALLLLERIKQPMPTEVAHG